MDEKKLQRINEVKQLLDNFSKIHLNDDLAGYCCKLWDKIGKKRNYIITGGQKEVWASAVIYLISRLNFLFDSKSSNSLTADMICDFFRTKKSTVSSKATDIEKVCKIKMGEESLCSSEISDSLSFIQLSNGMILTKAQAKESGYL
ncbi:MAG: DUF6398 domain-containing protein [Candidatus Omnitrophota bacterium]